MPRLSRPGVVVLVVGDGHGLPRRLPRRLHASTVNATGHRPPATCPRRLPSTLDGPSPTGRRHGLSLFLVSSGCGARLRGTRRPRGSHVCNHGVHDHAAMSPSGRRRWPASRAEHQRRAPTSGIYLGARPGFTSAAQSSLCSPSAPAPSSSHRVAATHSQHSPLPSHPPPHSPPSSSLPSVNTMVYSLSYRRPGRPSAASSAASLSGDHKQKSIHDSIKSGSSGLSHGIPEALSFDRIIAGGVCPVSAFSSLACFCYHMSLHV